METQIVMREIECIVVDYDPSIESLRRIEYFCYERGITCNRRYTEKNGKIKETLTLFNSQNDPFIVNFGDEVVFYPKTHGFEVIQKNI
ncbi:MAG: hypothetical protein ACRC1D_10430 [Culicoidibacterales bacterium]